MWADDRHVVEDEDFDGHRCDGTWYAANLSVHQTLDEMTFERGIWYAAMHGDLNRLKSLLDGRRTPVDSDLRDSYGYTALHYASGHGHVTVCELLLRRGADPNVVTRAGKATPLHRAAYRGHTNVVRLLLEEGGKLDAIDADGMTPLHKAAENSRADVYELLLAIDPAIASVKDNRGHTAADLLLAKLKV